jgi:hypothetical protein
MTELSNVAAVVPIVGEQVSSVELTTKAKGATQIAVKVYDRDPVLAAERAQTLYDRLRARYAPGPEHIP